MSKTTFIIFGATGDLVEKKIIPSLFNINQQEKYKDTFNVIAFTRRDWTSDDYRNFAKDVLHKKELDSNNHEVNKFLELFTHCKGDFDSYFGFENLSKLLRTDDNFKENNRIYYLSVSSDFYEPIFEKMAKYNLGNSLENPFERVIVEKPFGVNLATAKDLEASLKKYFKEEQVYRIDHYLGKEIIRNILDFRFQNKLFETVWNKDNIKKVEIVTNEEIGVETRGAFYDKVGALLDVVQNHLLEIVALISMNKPECFDCTPVRLARANAISKIKKLSIDEIKTQTYRAQHLGFRSIEGVDPNSNTETYTKIKLFIDDENWTGVPFILEAGKKLDKTTKEIRIYFENNQIVFKLVPEEKIQIKLNLSVIAKTLDVKIDEHAMQYVGEYSTMIKEAMDGKQTYFVTEEEVEACWAVIDPIRKAWDDNIAPLESYEPGVKPVVGNW